MSTEPLTRPAAYPPWAGEPCHQLPPMVITDQHELMRTLIRSDFSFGMDIVQTLNRSITRLLRGGELHAYPAEDRFLIDGQLLFEPAELNRWVHIHHIDEFTVLRETE